MNSDVVSQDLREMLIDRRAEHNFAAGVPDVEAPKEGLAVERGAPRQWSGLSHVGGIRPTPREHLPFLRSNQVNCLSDSVHAEGA